MKAGNGIINLFQKPFLQVHPSGAVQNIELCSHEYVNPKKLAGNDLKIDKIKTADTSHGNTCRFVYSMKLSGLDWVNQQ